MKKTWDKRLENLSFKLSDLSDKALEASEKAKVTREQTQETIDARISDLKGDVVALQERIRIADEENRGKIASALLKAQMTIEAKIQEKKDARDKKLLENYIDAQIEYIADSYETAAYLIANAELSILETVAAVSEYEKRFGEKTEEEEKPEA